MSDITNNSNQMVQPMGQFQMAAMSELSSINPVYTNARYAPSGDNNVQIPFLNFKEYGGRLTQWQPVSLTASTWKKQMNLPTNNTAFRQGVSQDAIGLGNTGNKDWVYATQTLANVSADTLFCTSNADCAAHPGTTCNANSESWPSAHGDQSGSVCSYTQYPEVQNGYSRKNANQGGIGRACKNDRDCGEGYQCNNETDTFGKNVQQTGFCAQKYTCPGGSTHFLGAPYNSGVPVPPDPSQNNNGNGYSTKEQCMNNALAQQDCVQNNGRYFATYPGYCPVPTNLRIGGAQGALRTTTSSQQNIGFSIPAYGQNSASASGGSTPAGALVSWNLASSANHASSMAGPLAYLQKINPIPTNQQ